MVEQKPEKLCVAGSKPAVGAILQAKLRQELVIRVLIVSVKPAWWPPRDRLGLLDARKILAPVVYAG